MNLMRGITMLFTDSKIDSEIDSEIESKKEISYRSSSYIKRDPMKEWTITWYEKNDSDQQIRRDKFDDTLLREFLDSLHKRSCTNIMLNLSPKESFRMPQELLINDIII